MQSVILHAIETKILVERDVYSKLPDVAASLEEKLINTNEGNGGRKENRCSKFV